ncbi:MAG: hypothetical protein L6R42_003959 [Xanthoria sp. 1 TBL-2021]|nr:MAG: hypothetical protein L6R42_003959 [Xanthoria sp. 1 TBL-2021]
MDINFDELERASAALMHGIYDTNCFDTDPFWFRESLNTGYDFRLGPREPELPQPSCRIDLDESGDFDPSGKRIKPLVPLKRKREPAPPELDENGDPLPRKPRQVTWQFGRFNGLSLIVTLKLNSSRGLHLLAAGIDNWPADDEPESSNSTHSHESIFTSPSGGISNTSLESYVEPYVFRPRDKACYDEYNQKDVDDDIDLTKVTLGHPAARGCIPCLKLRLPCPLLQEGATYPCRHCIEDGCDCELVIQPPRKRSCQGCRRRRLNCSYLDPTSDHSQPCRTCYAIGVKCVAGPANGRTRTGPSLDQVDPTKSLRKLSRIPLGRRFVNCTQCRQAKKWCSLRGGQEGPCNRCKTSGISCTFESLRSTLKKGIVQLEEVPPSLTDTKGKRADVFNDPFAAVIAQPVIKTITARLAHPISFNFTPSHVEDTPYCHWCADILHGLLGLGTLTVTVMGLTTITGRESSAGYTELEGGHTSLGHLPSRMCPECTLDRFSIIACSSHSLSALPSASRPIDQNRLMDALTGECKAEWDWCSICPSPEVYSCNCPSSMWLEDLGEDLERVGCGLKLCEDCAILLTECNGNLEEAVWKRMEEATRSGNEFAVRADAEFLTRGGELIRRVGAAEEG